MTQEIGIKITAAGAAQAQAELARVAGAADGLSKSFEKTGVSAAQTAAALRGVPAQFTDIITSLSSGQQPLTVFLQQGGQLKDMFGGAGNAARALSGYVAGLITPMTVLGGTVAAVAVGYAMGSKEAAEYARSIVLTGNAAGVTTGQLQAMAQALDNSTSATQGKAVDVLTQLVSTGRVSREVLQGAAAAAIELERVGGPAIKETVQAFAELGKDPLQASIKLNESTGFLTRSIYEQIKALSDQGRETEAAKVAQEAYANAVNQRVPQIEGQIGLLEKAWRGVAAGTKEAWDELLKIGRQTTVQDQIAGLTKRLAELQNAGGPSLLSQQQRQNLIAQTQQQLKLLEQAAGYEALSASYQAEQVKNVKDRIRFEKDGEAFLEKRVKADREIADVQQLRIRGVITEREEIARIAAIREKYKEKGRQETQSAFDDLARSFEKARQLAEADAEANGKASDAQRLRIELSGQLQAKVSKLTAEERARLEVMLQSAVAERERAEAARKAAEISRELSKAYDEAAKAREKMLSDLDKGIASGQREVQQLEDQLLALTKGEGALRERINLRAEEEAATLDLAAAAALLERADGAEYERLRQRATLIRQQIELRKQLASATDDKAADDANRRSAAKAAEEWQKAVDQIGQSLTDALMQGGKSGAEYIKGLFRAMVLRPVIQAIVNPVVGAGAGLLGLSGAAQAAGGVSSGLGLLGSASVFGNFGGGVLAGSSALLGEAGFGGAMSAAGTALQAGNISGGLGTALGAVGPYLAAATAIYSIARSLDKSGSPHLGSVITVDAQGRASTGGYDPSGILRNLNPQTDTALRSLGTGAVGILNALGGGGFSAQARFTADGVDPSFGAFSLLRNGQTVGGVTGGQPDGARAYGSNREQAFEAFAGDVARATRAALDQIDLPQWARDQINALGDGADLDKLSAVAQQIKATQDAFAAFQTSLEGYTGVFASIAGLSSDALAGLSNLSGGLDSLTGNLRTYYENFYTDAERAAMETGRITAALAEVGLTLPKTREEFRDLVDVQVALGTAGQPALAALLGVSGAFAELHPVVQTVEDVIRDTTRSIEDIARERAGLETELLKLQGNTAELRARELAALDPSNRALQQRIFALQDEIAANEAAAAATAAVAQQMQAAADAAAAGLSAIAAAAQRVESARSGVINTLQAIRDFGTQLNATVANIRGQIDALRAQARQQVGAAADGVRQALGVLSSTADAAAQRVTAANAAIGQATDRLDAAANAVRGAVASQRSAVESARGQVASLLAGMASDVQQAQSRVDSLMGKTGTGVDALADALRGLNSSVESFLFDLTRGEQSGSLTPRLDVARAGLLSDAAAAKSGDVLAIGRLVDAGKALLDASKAQARSAAELSADERLVRQVLGQFRGTTAASTPGGSDELAKAQADLAKAQADYAIAAAQASSLGVSMAQQGSAWSQAIAALTTAQGELQTIIGQASAAGISVAEQAASGVGGLVAEYVAAAAALRDARVEQQLAIVAQTTALNAYTTALGRAEAAGVRVEGQQKTFEQALTDYITAQQQAAAVGASTVGEQQSLLEQYQALGDDLTAAQQAVTDFESRIADVDFSPLDGLDPLAALLNNAARAVDEFTAALNERARLNAVGSWVDIGGGFQRYVSTGGATAVVRIGDENTDNLTLFGRDGRTFSGRAIKDFIGGLLAAGDFRSIYNEARAFGISSSDLDKLTGAGAPTLAWARALGLPAFATGTAYVPNTGLALVHEGERILPAADNTRLMSVLADAGDMAGELRALREEVAALRQESRAGMVAVAENTRSTARQLTRVIVDDRIQVDTTP